MFLKDTCADYNNSVPTLKFNVKSAISKYFFFLLLQLCRDEYIVHQPIKYMYICYIWEQLTWTTYKLFVIYFFLLKCSPEP